MDQMRPCHSTLPHLPYLGTKLVGIDCCSFHFRYLYYQENSLVFLEEVEESGCSQCHELGRRHRVCIGCRLLRQYLHLPELSDSFFFFGKIIAGGRLPVCEQDELRSPRTEHSPSMPLAQHTLPVFNAKSYIEWPQWKYKRVPGFGKVKLNDIVVFNFPAGDTVAVKYQQTTDFYTLAYSEGQRIYPKQVEMDSLTRAQQRAIYDLYYAAGRKQIMNNPRTYGEVLWRPVDRRENYVKRCVGLPGDTLQIVEGQVMIDGKAIENPENLQFNYFVQTTGPYITDDMFRELGISKADQMLIEDSGWEMGLLEIGLDSRNAQGKLNPVYHLPLTKKMYKTLSGNKKLISKIVMEPEDYAGQMYPLNLYTKWDRNNYGPIWIPAKGATITLTEDNLPIYERCIVAYEGNKLEIKPDGIYINGEKTDRYTFKMDYYWMMGDNRHNSADSRYWGFVPEDHVVGKPIVVWLSLDKDRGWFDGKIRWNRLFKWVG